MALLGQVLLDVIPTTQTDQLGGPLVAAQESEYIQIKKSGDARRAALMGSPTMLDFYDNSVLLGLRVKQLLNLISAK